jgi:hypothetical protein
MRDCNNRLSPDEEYLVHVLLSLREARLVDCLAAAESALR